MEDLMAVIVTRALERMIVVGGGILSIWIGYQLFALVPDRQDAGGRFSFPGGMSIVLSKVGPGVFFAVFGAGLLAFSLIMPVEFNEFKKSEIGTASQTTNVATPVITEVAKYLGNSPKVADASKRKAVAVPSSSPDRGQIIRIINNWVASPETADGATQLERRQAAQEAKLALIREIWEPDTWGDYSVFHRWVTIDPGSDLMELPSPTRLAVEYFSQRSK